MVCFRVEQVSKALQLSDLAADFQGIASLSVVPPPRCCFLTLEVHTLPEAFGAPALYQL